MTFTFEELNEIGDTAKDCGRNMPEAFHSIQNVTPKSMLCKRVIKDIGNIKEIELMDIVGKTQFDVQNRPSLIDVGGILVSAGSVGLRIKSQLLRKIENVVD